LKLLIYEYFSSGAPGHSGISEDGFMMLGALLSDFSLLPGLEIVTVIRPDLWARISPKIRAENLQPCLKGGAERSFLAALEACECALIVAPETAGTLARLTKLAEDRGKAVIGSSSAGVSLAGNKAASLALLEANGLPIPKWKHLVSSAFPEDFAQPFVVKPVEGAGGEGVRVIGTREQWATWKADASHTHEDFLAQEQVPGEAASVSCLVGDSVAAPICLNRQHIGPGEQPEFLGITAPYRHKWATQTMDIAQRVCELIPGLRGFVGVDFILGPGGPLVLEVNPRLTFAYLALREVAAQNIAGELLAICLEGSVPRRPQVSGSHTCLAKRK